MYNKIESMNGFPFANKMIDQSPLTTKQPTKSNKNRNLFCFIINSSMSPYVAW